jgi:TonB family protein
VSPQIQPRKTPLRAPLGERTAARHPANGVHVENGASVKWPEPAFRGRNATAASAEVQEPVEVLESRRIEWGAPPELPRVSTLAACVRFSIVTVMGLGLSMLIFLFLGSLQPNVDSIDKTAFADVVKFRVEPPPRPAAPPPPPEAEPEPQPKRRVPEPQSSERTLSQRATATRSAVQPAATGPRIAPTVGSGLGGISIQVGSAGMEDSLSVGIEEDFASAASDQLEMQRYEFERTRALEQTADEWKSAMADKKFVEKAVIAYQPKPAYPQSARQNEIEGVVQIRVLVSPEGKVVKHEIVASSPKGYFEDAILEVLPRWQFRPASDGKGRPVEFWTEFLYKFKLENG